MAYARTERRETTGIPRGIFWPLLGIGILAAILTTKQLHELYEDLIDDGLLNQSNPDPDDRNNKWDEIKRWIDWVKEELSKRPHS